MTTDDGRREFEAHALHRGLRVHLAVAFPGQYGSDITQEAWVAWQAARRFDAAAVERAAAGVLGACMDLGPEPAPLTTTQARYVARAALKAAGMDVE